MSLYQCYQTDEFTQVIPTSGFDSHAAVGSGSARGLMRLCSHILNANSLDAQYELDELFGFEGDGDNINYYVDEPDPSDPDPL